MNKIILVLLIIVMTMLGSLGGFFFKKSTAVKKIYYLLVNKYFYIGVLFYVLGALINIYVLKYMPYSVVLPMSSITYVWSIILSVLIIKEKLTYKKIIGITSIIVGAVFIGMY
jgi:drug/metabolite transporter (DMT)-like permease